MMPPPPLPPFFKPALLEPLGRVLGVDCVLFVELLSTLVLVLASAANTRSDKVIDAWPFLLLPTPTADEKVGAPLIVCLSGPAATREGGQG